MAADWLELPVNPIVATKQAECTFRLNLNQKGTGADLAFGVVWRCLNDSSTADKDSDELIVCFEQTFMDDTQSFVEMLIEQ